MCEQICDQSCDAPGDGHGDEPGEDDVPERPPRDALEREGARHSHEDDSTHGTVSHADRNAYLARDQHRERCA
jgi:hypothetical protein